MYIILQQCTTGQYNLSQRYKKKKKSVRLHMVNQQYNNKMTTTITRQSYRMLSSWGSISPLSAERQVSWLAKRSPFLWSEGPTASAITRVFVRRGPGFPPGTTSADRPARSCRTAHRMTEEGRASDNTKTTSQKFRHTLLTLSFSSFS